MRSPCIGHIQWSVCDDKFHDNAAVVNDDAAAVDDKDVAAADNAAADACNDDNDAARDDTDADADADDDAVSVGGVRWRDRLIPRDQKSCSERRFENGFYTTDVATMVTYTRNTTTKNTNTMNTNIIT